MDERRLRNFITLVSFDQKLHVTRVDIQDLKNQVDNLTNQKSSCEQELEAGQSLVVDKHKKVDENELAMRILEQRETEAKKKIDQVTQPKEYAALKKELNHVRSEQQQLEEELIAAWEELESVQRKLKQLQDSTRQKQTELDTAIRTAEEKLSALNLQVVESGEQRTELQAAVNPELLEMYEHMSGRVSNPVIAVQQGSCSACFYSVSVQDLQQLNSGALLPCRSCYRILYVPDAGDVSS